VCGVRNKRAERGWSEWELHDGGTLIRAAAVFGVSPKALSFTFSDQLQTHTTKHFSDPLFLPSLPLSFTF